MIVKPKVRGFICTTAHPEGCAESVRLQAEYVKQHPVSNAPKRVLVIGCSGGYGLASRITACFGGGADTVGVHFDKEPSGKRTGTAGFYTMRTFDQMAKEAGRISVSINGDAFSPEIKEKTLEAIRTLPGGQVDCVVYSLAAPRRTDYVSGAYYDSVIKPIGTAFEGKTVDVNSGVVSIAKVEPAQEQEIADTVTVMGGSDWKDWIDRLMEHDMLAEHACTMAFSYIGPVQTHAIYTNGTIGAAKKDLEKTAAVLCEKLAPLGGKAYISVNKALVTQASAAIPVVPLYITLLYKVMKEMHLHEDCIEQMQRLFTRLYQESGGNWDAVSVDEAGRIRLDDWEMRDDVQAKVQAVWDRVSTENIKEFADLQGYRDAFLHIFGFAIPGVDYDADVEII